MSQPLPPLRGTAASNSPPTLNPKLGSAAATSEDSALSTLSKSPPGSDLEDLEASERSVTFQPPGGRGLHQNAGIPAQTRRVGSEASHVDYDEEYADAFDETMPFRAPGSPVGVAGNGAFPAAGAASRPANDPLPSDKRSAIGSLEPGFELRVFALDRVGRRIPCSSGWGPPKPGSKPPPLFCLRDGEHMSTRSGSTFGADIDINEIDTEVEARLLSVGRPLPSTVALYGWTTWGEKPIQVALADGSLSGFEAVDGFAMRYLRENLVPRGKAAFRPSSSEHTLLGSSLRREQDASASDTTTPARANGEAPPLRRDMSLGTAVDVEVSGEENDDDDTISEDSKGDVFRSFENISPQLTSLRSNGRAPTFEELVMAGYLEARAPSRPLSSSTAGTSSGDALDPNGRGAAKKSKSRQIFEVEVMFDEMRVGLQKRLPDIYASSPHGECISSFSPSDDVPVDTRVDMKNVSSVDLDDAFFVADFDMTFSWLVKKPPAIISRHLEASTSAGDASGPSKLGTQNLTEAVGDAEPSKGVVHGASAAAAIPIQQAVWRPHWRFTNLLDQDSASIDERLSLSERQKLSRGMRLPRSVVDGYWRNGNPSRQDSRHLKEPENPYDADNTVATGATKPLEPRILKHGGKRLSDLRSSTGEEQALAEAMELLTRRASSATGQNRAIATASVNDGAIAQARGKHATASDADSFVSDVSELVLKVRCSGLRFSLALDNMDAFPFDVLSLPIMVAFREPHGLYQAHIARVPGPRLDLLEIQNLFLDSDEEEPLETSEARFSLSQSFKAAAAAELNRRNADKKITEVKDLRKISPTLNGEAQDVAAVAEEAVASAEVEMRAAARMLQELGELPVVAMPSFRPALDFVPIPGRMNLRVSNDQSGLHKGVTDHRLRSHKWGIADLYQQKTNDQFCSYMKVAVRSQDAQELRHRWSTPVLSITVNVWRKASFALDYVYMPLFLMTFISLTTILVGYGMELVSSFGDRCGITLTLLLTIVATEMPDHLKEVPQVISLKNWAFNFVVCVIIKDIFLSFLWWRFIYWDSGDIAGVNPWRDENQKSPEFPWWGRVWYLDGMATIAFFLYWVWQFDFFVLKPLFWNRPRQSTMSAIRFGASEGNADLLGRDSYLRAFVVERAATFLHELWRAAYTHESLKTKATKLRSAMRAAAHKQASPASSVETMRAIRRLHGQHNAFKSARRLGDELVRSGAEFDVPPRWKSRDDFKNPSNEGPQPPRTTEVGQTWVHPQTKEVYVNIDQPLDALPVSAKAANQEDATIVINHLELTPTASRTDLAAAHHAHWIAVNSWLPEDDKLRKPWTELPLVDRMKNLVTVNQVLDQAALAQQVHDSVQKIFNVDRDGVVSSTEFLQVEALHNLFSSNVRVPVVPGDVVTIREPLKNQPTCVRAVVISWQQRSHWNPVVSVPGRRASRSDVLAKAFSDEELEDYLEDDDYMFHGTVFFVALINPDEGSEFTCGVVHPVPKNERHRSLLVDGRVIAVPETALVFPGISCEDFTKSILRHSDWLFDPDGSCCINDHRCVHLDKAFGGK